LHWTLPYKGLLVPEVTNRWLICSLGAPPWCARDGLPLVGRIVPNLRGRGADGDLGLSVRYVRWPPD